ncbi:unnamed protein product [Lactuca virosa]|uniref:SGNH hydrolase-type esterase domain-containing protein n=1 Tax=Lactuca virosa TaxID=75947 RepID=A0AAU9MDL4_9ASTR|nr:unnamed protein product [Lactuca virosa]
MRFCFPNPNLIREGTRVTSCSSHLAVEKHRSVKYLEVEGGCYKAYIFMRGYSRWNSRQALQVVKQVFPQDDAVKPSLVIVYFGGNDSVLPDPDGLSSQFLMYHLMNLFETCGTFLPIYRDMA